MHVQRLAASCLVALAVGCAGVSQSPPPQPTPTTGASPSGDRVFDAERAYEDVRRLVAIGPRTSGSDGAARAREYLRGELEKLGLTVDETVNEKPAAPAAEGEEAAPAEAAGTFVHLSARIPGRGGQGEILLAASYDTAPAEDFENVAANGAASGPAVVLELARALAARPLEYDTRVAFVDGENGGGDAKQRMGSRSWAAGLRDSGELSRVRLAMVFRQVCDPDLSFERDLFSNRAYREVMWRTARRAGYTDAFPPDADFGTPSGIHHALLENGMRRVIAVVDDSYGGTEPPGALAGTAEDDLEHCSAESLGVTGSVAVATLENLTRMLSKVDRLSPEEPVEPEATEADESQAETPAAETPDAAMPAATTPEAAMPAAEPPAAEMPAAERPSETDVPETAVPAPPQGADE